MANLGDLIIIDEPESNLHPEAQAKLIEIIAEIVNRGLWVIITMYSPFILDYLNTLIKAYIVANMNDEAKKRVLEVIKNDNALLNPENVGVYLFTKDGCIENVKKDYTIDLESFRRVADELGMKYSELRIIEELYQKSMGESDETTV
jgi:predicted ATPase